MVNSYENENKQGFAGVREANLLRKINSRIKLKEGKGK